MSTVAERVAAYRAHLEEDMAKGLASAREHSDPNGKEAYFSLYEKIGVDLLNLLTTVYEARVVNEVNAHDRAKIVGGTLASALATVMLAPRQESNDLMTYFNHGLKALLFTDDLPEGVSVMKNGEVRRA